MPNRRAAQGGVPPVFTSPRGCAARLNLAWHALARTHPVFLAWSGGARTQRPGRPRERFLNLATFFRNRAITVRGSYAMNAGGRKE